jgi:putative PIN family toxin of toxin-antitoxin system
MLKAVLDANVFVSSLLVRVGQPARVLRAWREQRYLLITSSAIIAETEATLNYPRIRQKYAITDEDIEQLIALLKRDALLMPGNAQVAGAIPQDPADGRVLGCALDAQADFIVSGDRHLLDLETYSGIPILTVRQFLEQLPEASTATDVQGGTDGLA